MRMETMGDRSIEQARPAHDAPNEGRVSLPGRVDAMPSDHAGFGHVAAAGGDLVFGHLGALLDERPHNLLVERSVLTEDAERVSLALWG